MASAFLSIGVYLMSALDGFAFQRFVAFGFDIRAPGDSSIAVTCRSVHCLSSAYGRSIHGASNIQKQVKTTGTIVVPRLSQLVDTLKQQVG